MAYKKSNFFMNIFHSLWSLFLTGLFALLPITLTVAVFTLSFRTIQGWLQPLKQFHIPIINTIPHSEIILAIAIILIAGTLYNIFIFQPIIHAIEDIFKRLPLVRTVFSGIKKLVEAFSLQDKVSFNKVVLVEFPRPNMYSIGFLAGELSPRIAPNKERTYLSVFIPTTPNPTSGFLIILPEDQITILNITRQEAMTMIISGGIIQPENLIKN